MTLLGLLAIASVATTSYGERLLDALHARYPQISAAGIALTNSADQSIALNRQWRRLSRAKETLPLHDAMGNLIGNLTVDFSCARFDAPEIGRELSRRIYSSASLTEPDPYVADAIRAPAGQRLVDDAFQSDPDLITIALHVTPPGGAQNMIVASSFGRIGKTGDSDDEQVIRDSKTVREVTNDGNRVAIELPLLDAQRHVIGALSTSFRSKPETDVEQLELRAVGLQLRLARQIPDLNFLFRPATVSRQVRGARTCHS